MEQKASEIGINSVAAAIANAVNASLGVRLRRLPLTPQRVLEALLQQEEQKIGAGRGADHLAADGADRLD